MKKRKALIVEDEYIGALGLVDMFELWDWDVCPIASTGEKALEIAEREKPDIVLMDVSLHGSLSGADAARLIRQRFGIPVVFMSGYSEDEVRQLAGGKGEFHFIGKPLDPEMVKEAIENVLARKKRSRNLKN